MSYLNVHSGALGETLPIRCYIDFPRDNAPPLRHAFEQPRVALTAWRTEDVVPLLLEIERHARRGRWAVGVVAYEAAPAFDPAFKTLAPLTELPLAAFAIFDAPMAAAEKQHEKPFAFSHWCAGIPRADFLEKVERVRTGIAAGDYYQVNLSTRLRARFGGEHQAFFKCLCDAQPGSYALYLDYENWQIASVSPELFFAWTPATGDLVVTRPMKGTAPLSKSAVEGASAKDRAENLMIVDLLRNDIARVARQGSVSVPELFAIQSLSTVRQMTSTITAVTAPDCDLAKIFTALFPCGSVTGAPKIAAMKEIAALETSPRGAYCGALGVVQPGGNALFSVGIRTVTLGQGQAECGLGSGITSDSSAAGEYEECQIKRRFLLRASAAFDLLESIKLQDGAYWLLDRHCERLERTAEYFGFAFDGDAIHGALSEVLARHQTGGHGVRLLLSRNGAIKTSSCATRPRIVRFMKLLPRGIRIFLIPFSSMSATKSPNSHAAMLRWNWMASPSRQRRSAVFCREHSAPSCWRRQS